MSFFYKATPTADATWAVDISSEGPVLISRKLWNDLELKNHIAITTFDHSRPLIYPAVADDSLGEGNAIRVPKTFPAQYPAVFKASRATRNVQVTPTTPAVLSLVVVVALSPLAYNMVSRDPSYLRSSLLERKRVLRQGEILTIPNADDPQSSPIQYQLQLLEPVLAGCVEEADTKLIVLSPLASTSSAIIHDDAKEAAEQELVEIDEKFLESSLVGVSFEHARIQARDSKKPAARRYSARSLGCPASLPEDQHTLYMRTAELGRLGILDGYWAVASGSSPSQSRLVRLVADDHLVDDSTSISGSPFLLWNLLGPESARDSQQLSITSTPFGPHDPSIPVAHSITVARVSSPLSIDRRNLPQFLEGLKQFFETGRRLLKLGDIFGVALNTDVSRGELGIEGVGREPARCLQNRSNGVVFFKVTNIEYNPIGGSDGSSQDTYIGSTLGELGCWVDSSQTRIVQAGIENTRIPDVISYMKLDVDSNLSRIRSTGSSRLTGPSSPYAKLCDLISAALSTHASDYQLNLSFVLEGSRGIGKFTVISWVAQQLGFHLFEVDCYDVLGESDVKTEATLRVRFEQAASCSPCILVLRHLEAFSQSTQAMDQTKEPLVTSTLKDLLEDIGPNWKLSGYPLVVVGTCCDVDRVPSSLLSVFKRRVDVQAPNESERLEILKCLLDREFIASDVSLNHIATQTAALVAADLKDLVVRAKDIAFERAGSSGQLAQDMYSLVPLSAADFEIALGKSRESYSESIGAPKIPTVSWDDVGGLAYVKSDILDTIQLPLEHPELFADGLKKRSGILLYGPPGTGKTLIAKAVATSCALNFFSVKGPELLNMYIGESEANVRRVFQRARDAKPCVIFFDELDSVAPKRGNHGDSGGVMDRIVSQLLAELDGMSSGSEGADVFVIGATNRPDLLDPALLRPGRFDRMLYLGVSETHEAQLNILEALTRKFRLDPELNLGAIADQCPFNYTGADFYALCSDAMLNAMSRKAQEIDAKIATMNDEPAAAGQPHPITPQYYLAEYATEDEIAVQVSKDDFERALKALVPSVSQSEMEHYRLVQQKFSTTTVE